MAQVHKGEAKAAVTVVGSEETTYGFRINFGFNNTCLSSSSYGVNIVSG